MSSEQCNGDSRIKGSFNRLPLQNSNEDTTAQEHALHIDLLPELTQSDG